MSRNVRWGCHGLLASRGRATLLAVGDAWFWHPLDNLANAVAAQLPNHTLLVAGRGPSEPADWAGRCRREIDFAFEHFGAGAQALLLSGGATALVGAHELPALLRADCRRATTVADCWRRGEPGATLRRIADHQRALITRFRACNRYAPVVLQGYDAAWPADGAGFGPAAWLQPAFDAAQLPRALWRELFATLLQRLQAGQQALADQPALGVIAAPMPGDPPPGAAPWWAGELQLSPAGHRRLARQALLPALHRAIV